MFRTTGGVYAPSGSRASATRSSFRPLSLAREGWLTLWFGRILLFSIIAQIGLIALVIVGAIAASLLGV